MVTTTARDTRERARGALLGLAVGDALGAPAENMRPSEIRRRWGRIEGFVTDSPAGTDDTEYAIFSALLLARHGSALTVHHVERAWHHWIADLDEGPFRGAGFSERGTLENLRRGLAAPISAQHRHAWSDGLAMRAAPFGVFAAGRPAEAARLVAIDGSVSHDGEGIYGGQAVAAGVAAAMAGAGVTSVIAAALSAVPMDSWTARSLRRAVVAAQRVQPDPSPANVRSARRSSSAATPGRTWPRKRWAWRSAPSRRRGATSVRRSSRPSTWAATPTPRRRWRAPWPARWRARRRSPRNGRGPSRR